MLRFVKDHDCVLSPRQTILLS